MNKHDRDNYLFIMSLSPQQFENWYATISDDDAQYAIELIRMARTELIQQTAEILDDVENLFDAKEALGKFTLTGVVK
jgi:hypothetical protein